MPLKFFVLAFPLRLFVPHRDILLVFKLEVIDCFLQSVYFVDVSLLSIHQHEASVVLGGGFGL